MLAPVRMIVTYPLYFALERAVFSSQTFEKTWSNLRPKLERGVDLIAQEVHPQGGSFVRRYVYQEPAIKRICTECLHEMFSNEVMMLLTQVSSIRKDISKRQKQIIEWEKDLIAAPKKSWNPLNFSQNKLKEKISQGKAKIASDESRIAELSKKALSSLHARGVKMESGQLESLLESVDGEDIASVLSVADVVSQIFSRLEAQLSESSATPELSKTYAGFYMMCSRLYLEAINRALDRIGKVYLKQIAGIEQQAFRQINKAEEKLALPDLADSARTTLKNNVEINRQVLEVVKFYTRHLNKRAKELIELQTKATVNYEIALNTFLTMKIGASLADCISQAEKDMAQIFEFEPPSLSQLYDAGFKEQFKAVTNQIRK